MRSLINPQSILYRTRTVENERSSLTHLTAGHLKSVALACWRSTVKLIVPPELRMTQTQLTSHFAQKEMAMIRPDGERVRSSEGDAWSPLGFSRASLSH